MPKNGKKKH